MATADELRELLGTKFIIFDTNILIEAFKHFDSFKVLLNDLHHYNCKPLYFPLIEFEFTRDAMRPEHNKARRGFLETIIGGTKLPINDDLVDIAVEIARVYAHQKDIASNKISIVDCCVAAYMRKYQNKLFLLTMNHRDFPLVLFDRIQPFALDANDNVLAPAIYKFNEAKWKSCFDNYQKVH